METLELIKKAEAAASRAVSEAEKQKITLIGDAKKQSGELEKKSAAERAEYLEKQLEEAKAAISEEKSRLMAQNSVKLSKLHESASELAEKEANFIIEKFRDAVQNVKS